MPTQTGTLGQLWLRSILPADIYDGQPLDKKTLAKVLTEVALKHPEKYRDITFQLNQLGRKSAYFTGGNSFGLKHLAKARVALENRRKLQPLLNAIIDDDSLDSKTRTQKIADLVNPLIEQEREQIYAESEQDGNPLVEQLKGAGRGNKINLASLRGSDGLYTDQRGRLLPVPVLRSYSEGLSPMEYLATTFGARQGLIQTKFSVADSGFFGKQLVQAAHRLIVEGLDAEKDPDTVRGMPVAVDDPDNEGALLSQAVGNYPRNTVLTPKILRDIARQGVGRILVRSPIAFGSPGGGVYARDVGIREFGRLPIRGERVGITGAQAVAEPLSQGMLAGKHSAGVAGASSTQSLYDTVNQMIQVPEHIKGGGTHARVDGIVRRIEDAPAGGKYLYIDNERHFVAPGFNIQVKAGQDIEAGDLLTDGIPNPAIVVQHKGVGEGRRYFVDAFRKAVRAGNVNTNRKNIELLARGLINHVRVTEELDEHSPDDVIPYSTLEHSYKPRQNYQTLAPKQAVGKYLERPYLHYTIGTKIRPSMLKDFDEFGVQNIDVHDDEPPFQPEMVRAMSNLRHDSDWMVRQFGSYLKDGLLDATHRGGVSDQAGTSFVPSLARGVDFKTYQPKPEPVAGQKTITPSVLSSPRAHTSVLAMGKRPAGA